jgi:hypothetical protein
MLSAKPTTKRKAGAAKQRVNFVLKRMGMASLIPNMGQFAGQLMKRASVRDLRPVPSGIAECPVTRLSALALQLFRNRRRAMWSAVSTGQGIALLRQGSQERHLPAAALPGRNGINFSDPSR